MLTVEGEIMKTTCSSFGLVQNYISLKFISDQIRNRYMVCVTIFDYNKILKRAFRLFILVISISTVSPAALLSQVAPDLGTASNFALFTSLGNVENMGTTATHITGNAGTDGPGASVITGYVLPAKIVGSQEIRNAATLQAKLDVQAVYTDLAGRTPIVPNHAVAYGSGEILGPGVYGGTAGAGSLLGILTLNAGGDPNAIFIFKIAAAFTSAASSEVKLVSGAQASNVFWVSGAAMNLGASTIMKGTLITGAGEVGLGTLCKLEGRMLSVSGRILTKDNDTVWLPSSALPVELISFKGSRSGEGSAVLKWSTASEINNDFFTIERSADAVNWETVGAVAGAGNSTEQINYEFTDFSCPNGATYYRLKQTDFDKKFKYEAKIYIEKHKDPDQLFIHIDPLNNYLNIVNIEGEKDIKAIHIYNVYGNEIYHSTNNESRIDISNFKNGSYLISIYLKSKIRILKFIVYKK
jgi:hypothetical protein